jgi:nucleoside-diphosphate-sugar epimerase
MNLYQFVHVDDVARLIAFILRRAENDPQLTILNVAGRGEPMTFAQCLQATKAKLVRLPGRAACGAALRLFWKMGISGVPPESLPYLLGSYTMNTRRLREFLGGDYEKVLRFTSREALLDSFARPSD